VRSQWDEQASKTGQGRLISRAKCSHVLVGVKPKAPLVQHAGQGSAGLIEVWLLANECFKAFDCFLPSPRTGQQHRRVDLKLPPIVDGLICGVLERIDGLIDLAPSDEEFRAQTHCLWVIRVPQQVRLQLPLRLTQIAGVNVTLDLGQRTGATCLRFGRAACLDVR
jgi:hypothetical protein